jgi:cytochrome o ubiquinol oxidase subunit 2
VTFINRISVGVLALALPLAGCGGVLDPHGPIGTSERLILIDSVAIMLVIVIPVIVATLGFAWWFRASNDRATYLPYWSFSGQLELIVWAIPALVITIRSGQSSHNRLQSRSRSCRSIGNGCSSIPMTASPASIN